MGRTSHLKKERQVCLSNKLAEDPFLTDEELSEMFYVSVPTIRLDRLELGIPELRERVKNVAEKNHTKVKSLIDNDIVGEILHIELGESAISILETNSEMCFKKNNVVRGHYIYSLAESLAIALIDADFALVGVANIKYKIPVLSGTRLTAKAEVKRKRVNSYFVWVKIYEKQLEVFRGKFILVANDST
jgi:acyl-coenzyme A thioesterase PaaI-like protein